jgi:hypothetical protein
MSTSKTGKHGHAKVHMIAVDVSLVSGGLDMLVEMESKREV